jgi:hypothetical protein
MRTGVNSRIGRTGSVSPEEAAIETVGRRIRLCRGRAVLTDRDLAGLYGVSVNRLLTALGAGGPAPGEFCFRPEPDEIISFPGDADGPPMSGFVLTEYGALVAAIRLHEPATFAISVRVIRAFLRVRQAG